MSLVASTVIAGAAVVAAGTGACAAIQSGKSANAANASAQTQVGMEQTQFGEQQQYAQKLQELIANPGSVTSLPGYQFNFDQGSQAVARQMAAGGFLNSGNEATALTQYGQNYAMSTFNQQAQLLSSLAGFNAPAYGSNAAASTNAGTNAGNSAFNQLGGVLASLGYSANRYAPQTGNAPYSSNPGLDASEANLAMPGGGTAATLW